MRDGRVVAAAQGEGERDIREFTAQLLQQFLGRPVSPDAILRQLQRVGSADLLASQHLGQALLE